MSSIGELRTLINDIKKLQGDISTGDLKHIKTELENIKKKDPKDRTPAEQSAMEELQSQLKLKMEFYSNTHTTMTTAQKEVSDALRGLIRG
jgi:hypothetical protein